MATYPTRSKSLTRLATRPVTRLAVGAAVHGSVPGYTWHPDSLAYFHRVESLSGGVVDNKLAVDRFFHRLDDYDLRQYIREAYLLCGVSYEGLSAKLVHDEGVTPNLVLNNFVSGDYKRDGLLAGLKGNGSTSFIDTDFLRAALPETVSLSAFVTEDGPSDIANWIGNIHNGFGTVLQRVNSSNVRFNNYGSNSTGAQRNHSSYTPAYWTGVASGEEPNRIRRLFRNGQSPATDSIDRAHTIGGRSFVLFAVRNTSLELTNFSPHRLAFVHAGLELGETQVEDLNTAVQQLMIDLGVIQEALS